MFISLNTIGYKEVFKHFKGELNFHETTELIKTNSRRFAKKQLSWLKNNGNHYWLESVESNKKNIEKLFQKIVKKKLILLFNHSIYSK